ncbi:MAG: hypothetical protein RL336_1322 [Pseudomonadota bacterium]|jgi:membrane protease subunit (stomatin/prohibitin family)
MAILDLIEFVDHAGDIMVTQVPYDGDAQIRMGSQLVVRQTQTAVLSKDGQFLDKFGPGRHTLQTNNLPLMGTIIGAAFGGKSPFQASVYFVGKQVFNNLGWGTQTPITMRDSELRMVTLRSHGIFSMRIVDELLFLTKLVGSKGMQTTYHLENFFRSIIISRLVESIANELSTILDLAKYYRKIGESVKLAVSDELAQYGIELIDLVIEAITPAPEIQAMINKASGIAAQNTMSYSEIARADAMVEAAKNPGGSSGEGVGAGLGVGFGLSMAQMAMQNTNIQSLTPKQEANSEGKMTPIDKLRQIKAMLDEGLITEEQFAKERQEILDEM